MATFKGRFPVRRDIVLVLATVAFVVFSWSILMFMKKLPNWLLFFNLWDLVGAFAYTQVFAFVESVLTVLGLILLCAVLPARLFKDRFVALGSAFVLLTAGWIIADKIDIIQFFRPLWLALYLLSLAVIYALIWYRVRLAEALCSFAERLTVLLYVYVPIVVLGVMIIIVRNV